MRTDSMSFGRSRARLLNQDSSRVTFADVAGVDEAKDELSEVVEFLSNPKKFTRLGGRIPKGVLLVGPPGTGKTLLARAVAGEAGVPFFSISGSDFVEMFVGVGASRVRDLFVQGKKNAPCLIFIDEIDAVGRQRGAGLGGGHDEREQTLNQLLVEMDGFESNEGVILIAATNRPDVLDPALLRPGRFDRQVVVPTPDLRGRRRILEVHTKRTPLAGDVDLEVLARGTPGFSGADLENLVNEAALQAAKLNQDRLDMRHPFHGRQLQGRHVAARNINVLEHINIDWRDALDITVVGVLLYQVIQMLRGSRALTVLTGLGLLTLLYFFSNALGLYTLTWLLQHIFSSLFILIVVIFQTDIRQALGEMGANHFFRKSATKNLGVEEVVTACVEMARLRVGALIVVERSMVEGENPDKVKMYAEDLAVVVERELR